MREAAREVLTFVAGVSYEEFLGNKLLQLGIERELEIIGEAARHISPDYRSAHGDIPWSSIIAERNVLIHAYPDILLELVWDIVQTDLPTLLEKLEKLLSENSQA